ncbi:hypothetical protein KIN20_032895 [Parelaphostrongylus tenuis]|uniref:Uncharacterized protein n=1 Tax=Parelaphostrongylus tenuis TaxID=148309 RepID=A0AAD5R7K9_PARTN|nr:hypothetical protein KIN20_032895 [Parelaphostrongylus tenuis]
METPEAFYGQQNHPKFHTRNLERAINKKKAWSKPLPADVSDLFFVAAAPKHVDDLAVNPRQINKLKALFSGDNNGGKVILVTGPPGSGKTTAIDVIAKSLNFEVLKWEHSMSLEIANYGADRYLKEENDMTSLLRFLRTSSLPVSRKGRKSRKKSRGVVYHIDELPLSAYSDVNEFRRSVSPYLLANKHFVVFDLTSRDSSWFFSPKRVFQKCFINAMNIFEIEFYPVAATFMRNCLRRTVDRMGFRNRLSAQDYRAVESIAKGDIRSAINIIQCSLLSSRENFYIPPIFEATSNDELFHMLGALLYAKRQNNNPETSRQEDTVREELRRPPPTREINDILDMSRASPDTVMMFLHEHEPKFSGTIAATRKVFDAMSISDALLNSWENRLLVQDYSSQICARATVFYNYQANRIARGFYHYSRPKWYLLADKTTELRKEVTEVMSPLTSHGTRHMEIDIPFLSLIQPSLTGSQYRLVTYLTRPWTFSWSTERALWDHRIATDPSYRMAQLRESVDKESLMRYSQGVEESDEETFFIEDSDDATQSDDSFVMSSNI